MAKNVTKITDDGILAFFHHLTGTKTSQNETIQFWTFWTFLLKPPQPFTGLFAHMRGPRDFMG